METTTQAELPDEQDGTTETTEEREKRTKRTFPIRIFVGSAADGWKIAGPESFNDERDALRWVRDNGKDGVGYMLARVHLAQKIEPRRLVDTEV